MDVKTARSGPFTHARTHSSTHAHSHSHPIAADFRLLGGPAATTKQPKGKQKENEHWNFNWWDYTALIESRKSPVQWTGSALILTAHATEPQVACIYSPTNEHFFLPSPPTLTASPTSFEPPTVISASPQEDWIFAYFPGKNCDGVGCIWNKSNAINKWLVKEWTTYPRGDHAVEARWSYLNREWSSSETGTPTRLPLLGPFIPFQDPVLFVVTETRRLNACYAHPQNGHIQMLNMSLARKSSENTSQSRPLEERADGPSGLGRCTHAAIGFGYDESSILIATFSTFVPSSTSESHSINAEDPLSMSYTPEAFVPDYSSEWEAWRDENVIDVCEVTYTTKGSQLVLNTTPLPAIRDFREGRYLTGLSFVPCLSSPQTGPIIPVTPTQTHRLVTPQSSPANQVNQSPSRSPLKTPVKTPPKPNMEKVVGKSIVVKLYLLCTTLDCGYTAQNITSNVTLYAFHRNPADNATWYNKRIAHLPIPSGVVAHITPFQTVNNSTNISALLCVLNTEGVPQKWSKRQHLSVGSLRVVRLPELQYDELYESTNIICPIGPFGVELPSSFVLSPNQAQCCIVRQSPYTISTSLYTCPGRLGFNNSDKSILAPSMACAAQRSATAIDIVNPLSQGSTSLTTIENMLYKSFSDLISSNCGFTESRFPDFLGLAVEFFKTKVSSCTSGSVKDDLESRCRVGVDICSLAACNSCWEDMYDNSGEFILDNSWQLISFCSYFVEEFLNRLLKDCVEYFEELRLLDGSNPSPDSEGKSPSPDKNTDEKAIKIDSAGTSLNLTSSFIHLVHPYALNNVILFLEHVKQFRCFLRSNTSQEDKYQVARELLMDIIDSSAIDLGALEKVLLEVKDEVKSNADRSPEDSRRCLVSLKPPTSYAPLFQKIVTKLMQAQVVDNFRLFVTPNELVDSFIGLRAGQTSKNTDRDIITKSQLRSPAVYCTRCKGRTASDKGFTTSRWSVWEKTWNKRCICGGLWWSKTI